MVQAHPAEVAVAEAEMTIRTTMIPHAGEEATMVPDSLATKGIAIKAMTSVSC